VKKTRGDISPRLTQHRSLRSQTCQRGRRGLNLCQLTCLIPRWGGRGDHVGSCYVSVRWCKRGRQNCLRWWDIDANTPIHVERRNPKRQQNAAIIDLIHLYVACRLLVATTSHSTAARPRRVPKMTAKGILSQPPMFLWRLVSNRERANLRT
jgi:hypothetical protein